MTGPTGEGMLLGTAPYMSPEQARGQTVDQRTDVWAFGCVLYEMLTGRRAFPGATASDTIAAILEREPDWSLLPPATPPHIHRLLRRCLEKDAKQRWRAIADARFEIDDALTVTSAARASSRRTTLLTVVSVLAVVGVVAVGWWVTIGRGLNAPVQPIHKQITFVGGVLDATLSPDGRTIAFVTENRGSRRILVQDVAGGPSLEWARGVEGGLWWSPNGGQLIYRVGNGELFLVSRLGGQARRLDNEASLLAWSPDGSQLAVTSQNTQGFRIVGVDGEVIHEVALPELRWIFDIDWQRTSNRLVVLEEDDQNHFVLWSMTTEGKERRRVYSDAEPLSSPQWASAGDIIYCLRTRNDAAELLALDASRQEAKPQVLLSGLPGATSLSISADGRTALMGAECRASICRG